MNSNGKVDLGIVTFEPIPVGMAGTNRILSWAIALAERGISVKIYIVKPTEKAGRILNSEVNGIYKGIAFEYVSNSTIWPIQKSKFNKFKLLFLCYYRLAGRLIDDKPPVVVTYLYTNDVFVRIVMLLLRKFAHFRLIIEESEYPSIFKKTDAGKWYRSFYLRLYKYSDGMLVISKELQNYYQNLCKAEIFLLPMTVEVSRFNISRTEPVAQKYFIYIGGSGGFYRDGVLDILKAFRLFSVKKPDFIFHVVGPIDNSSAEYEKLVEYIAENKLGDKIIFTGSKPTGEIPGLLSGATGIVMAPPHDFSSGGFPTKLGEFLASGTPVVSTRVSDIPLYLNETNSFIVDPGDTDAISAAMEYIVDNPEKSQAIGEKGKDLAKAAFSADSYIEPLLTFFFGNKYN
jgi:glycosyltransferase involved in cell wall biosynthesis